MTLEGLKALYESKIPKRGEIIVEFKESQTTGVAGVIGNVIMNITGATTTNGFKGIAGKYDRNYLMKFDKDISGASVRFTRADTQKKVDVIYDPSNILPDRNMSVFMQKSIQGTATEDERIEFGKLWQQRVEMISKNLATVIKTKLI